MKALICLACQSEYIALTATDMGFKKLINMKDNKIGPSMLINGFSGICNHLSNNGFRLVHNTQWNFVDDDLGVAQKRWYKLDRIENIVGKRENAGHKHFLIFQQFMFSKAFFKGKHMIVWQKGYRKPYEIPDITIRVNIRWKLTHTNLFLMYRNNFWVWGGPCKISGKHAASWDVNLSKGSRLWNAAPSKPANT